MKDNNSKNIRPARIRIVNPTPKLNSSVSIFQENDKDNSSTSSKLNLLLFITCGSIVFVLLDILKIWQILLPTSQSWKQSTITYLFYLILVFVLPTMIYFILKPHKYSNLKFRSEVMTGLISFIIGIPFAYILAVISFFISFFLQKLELITNLISFGDKYQHVPENNLVYQLIFIVIICIIPAVVVEISLRGILINEMLSSKRQATAIFLSAFLTGLLTFQKQEFIAYFGLGWLVSMIFIQHQSIIAASLCHFSFNFTYHFLLVKVPSLNLNHLSTTGPYLDRLLPTIGKLLIAATIFLPLFVILSQTKTINPLFNSDEILYRHAKKKESNNKIFRLCLFCLIILFFISNIIN